MLTTDWWGLWRPYERSADRGVIPNDARYGFLEGTVGILRLLRSCPEDLAFIDKYGINVDASNRTQSYWNDSNEGTTNCA